MNCRLRKVVCFLSVAGFCALLCGCRTYNDSVWKTVDFNSVPGEATVFINGKNCGMTPRTERLSKRGNYEVRFSKPGYFDEDFVLASFSDDRGMPDILDSVEIDLVKITPETLALREQLARDRMPAGTQEEAAPAEVVAEAPTPGLSPAAREFAARPKPTDFTDFRLQEKALKRLFLRGEITEAEYNTLHEALYSSYNENRLLKAPRLGTYEKAL